MTIIRRPFGNACSLPARLSPMNSLRRQPDGIRFLPCPDFLVWQVDGDGIVRASDGTAAAEFQSRIDAARGQPYHATIPKGTKVAAMIAAALAGMPKAGVAEAWDANWFHIVMPSKCGWGVDGWSVRLPEGLAEEEPDGSDEPRRRTWEIAGLPRTAHESYRDGDFFIKVDGFAGVAMGRRITDAEFLALHMEHGPHMRLTDDSGQACPSRPPLRLVP